MTENGMGRPLDKKSLYFFKKSHKVTKSIFICSYPKRSGSLKFIFALNFCDRGHQKTQCSTQETQ